MQPNLKFLGKIETPSGESASLCFQCATCTASCTSARASSLRTRKLMRQAQLGLQDKIFSSEAIWMCTQCYRCFVRCPRKVDIPGTIVALRSLSLERGLAPEAVAAAENAILQLNNVFSMDPSLRTDWVDYTGARVKQKKKADTVYFVGCVTSYSGRTQGIAHAISSILNHVKESWTVLEDERCCGHPLALVGEAEKVKEHAKHNIRAIEAKGAERVVTGCPGCYLELKNEYQRYLGRKPKFEVLHFTELLNGYIAEGRLKVPKSQMKVTYHDPCELGRIGGIFDEPRNILKASAAEFVETEDELMDGSCCGAGGFVKGTNLSLASALADMRLKTLENTGAKACVSACPSCYQNLLEAAGRCGDSMQIMDIAELVAQQLGLA